MIYRRNRQRQRSLNRRLMLETFEPRQLMAVDGFNSLPPPPASNPPPEISWIINGNPTNAYPSVGIVGDTTGGFCSGTLITSEYVLTAAHCAEGVGNTAGRFRLGSTNYATSQVIIHPNYNTAQFGTDAANDIALYKLNTAVPGVTPSNLFRGTPTVGSVLTLVGFGGGGTGSTGSNGDFGTKRVGTTPIDRVTSTLIHWTFENSSESNTAPGDSGGPAFLVVDGEYQVAGVTSGGTLASAGYGDESYDTRVDAYLTWLDGIINAEPTTNFIDYTVAGSTYSQNFNSLAASGSSSTLPSGWGFLETGTNANTSYDASDGTANTGNTYSFGSTSSTDRALGTLLSSSNTSTIGATVKNSTGSTLTSLSIAYVGEQWRLGATGRADRLDFQYSLDATSFSTGTWVDVNALDFASPTTTGTTGKLDGNATANRTNVTGSINSLSLANGASIWIRWNDLNATSSDDGLAIDDFTLIATAGSVTNNPPTGLTSTPSSVTLPENTSTTSRVKLSDLAVVDDGVGTNVLSVSGTDASAFEIIGTELYLKAGTTLSATSKPTYSISINVDDTSVGTTPDVTIAFQLTISAPLTSQTITFPAIGDKVFGSAPFALTATASSGLAVSYVVIAGPATVSGDTVTLTGVGTVTIEARQAGNSTYAAATPVQRSFAVTSDSSSTTLLSEDFANLTAGGDTATSGTGSPSSTEVTTNLTTNFPSSVKAYAAGGKVKLGSSSAAGSITSKSLDLSGNGGAFTVSLDVKGWTTVEGDIKVTVGTLTPQTITYTATMSSSYQTKTLSFTGGQANSTIKIETTAKRAFLDNIIVTTGSTSSTPTITGAATASAFTTTYGTASAAQSFSISGSNLTENLVATAPTGFEVSSDGTTYGSTATFTQSSGTASGTLRIRLATTAAVSGSYNSQNIVLSSTGATSVNIGTAASGNSVATKALTITGLSAANKGFDGTTTVSVTGTPTYSGLVNSESFSVSGSVSWAFPDANVGSNKTLARTGNYEAPSTNYSVTQPTLTASITAVAPSAPTISSVTAGNSQLSVAFTAPSSNGGATITDYKYSLDGGSFVAVGSTTSPFTISGLTNGQVYAVRLRAVNAAGEGSASDPVNGTPAAPGSPVINPQTFTINSKALNNALVGAVAASDPDVGQTLTYAITAGNGDGAYAINSTTGRITIADATKLPKVAKGSTTVDSVLTVSVTDSGATPLSSNAAVTVTLSSATSPVVRMAPTVNAASFSIAENNKPLAKVGSIKPLAAYTGQKFTFNPLSGTDAASFAIDTKGGITLASGVSLNFEGKNSYTFNVNVADSLDATKVTTAAVTVGVTDVNERAAFALVDAENDSIAITDKGAAAITIDESTPASGTINGLLVATLSVTDVDAAGINAPTAVLDKTGAFSFDPATGEIRVANASLVDFEKSKSFKLSFAVTDNAVAGDAKSKPITTKLTIVINVNDLNEAPVIGSPDIFTVARANKEGAKVGTVIAKDPDKTKQTLTYTIQSQVNSLGASVSIFAISAKGAITLTPRAATPAGVTSYTLVVKVNDGLLETFQTITVNVVG